MLSATEVRENGSNAIFRAMKARVVGPVVAAEQIDAETV